MDLISSINIHVYFILFNFDYQKDIETYHIFLNYNLLIYHYLDIA